MAACITTALEVGGIHHFRRKHVLFFKHGELIFSLDVDVGYLCPHENMDLYLLVFLILVKRMMQMSESLKSMQEFIVFH